MKKILLIVPCFNEESRMNFPAFEAGARDCERQGIKLSFLFTNDGSSDRTRALLDEYCAQNSDAHCYHLPQNAGKGNAIQECYQAKKNELNFQQYDWVGFWDADLATPLTEIPKMLTYLSFFQGQEVSAVFGSRISRLGSRIVRQMHRHYLGRIFVTLVSNVLGVKAYDSQCGAKLFTPNAAEVAFENSFISRWIFDVEILLRLKEERIVEFPLFNWEDIPGSKVKVFREMFRVLKDLYKIKETYSS